MILGGFNIDFGAWGFGVVFSALLFEWFLLLWTILYKSIPEGNLNWFLSKFKLLLF